MKTFAITFATFLVLGLHPLTSFAAPLHAVAAENAGRAGDPVAEANAEKAAGPVGGYGGGGFPTANDPVAAANALRAGDLNAYHNAGGA